MFTLLSAAAREVFEIAGFLRAQLGLSGAEGAPLWFFLAETVALTALLRWALSAFDLRPARARAFWVAVPLLGLFALLLVNRISNPPRALPELRARIDGVDFTDFAQDGRLRLLAVPAVTISNVGEGTPASRFALSLHLPDGTVVRGQRLAITDRLEIPFPDGSTLVAPEADSLEQWSAREIRRGGTAAGRLAYVFPSLSGSDLKAGGVFFQLTMTDGWGRAYATPLVAAGQPIASAEDAGSFAGLSTEVRPPAPAPEPGPRPHR
jgi:hypothetical protein